MNKRDIRVATQILTGQQCLPHVGTISNALAAESRVLRHSLKHCHGNCGQKQSKKDYLLLEQTTAWSSETLQHDLND